MRFPVLASLPLTILFGGAPAVSGPVQWDGNGHYYEVVTTLLLAPEAEAAANASTFMGMPGYLVNITSEAEWQFVRSLLDVTDLFSAIVGLSDRDEEGTFRYMGGPEEGLVASFLPWAPNEPNNFGDGEDYVEMFSGTGLYNDIQPPGEDYDARRGYIVEYSGGITVIPLPAAGWLLLASLGGLAALRRRKG